MIPSAIVNELDGQLGVVPSGVGRLTCYVGQAQSGPINTPVAYASIPAIVAAYTGGPLVERACYDLENGGGPGVVVLCRTDQTTAGAATAVVYTGTGTSVVTVSVSPTAPWDNFDVVVQVILGGTIGTGPITIRVSLDGGKTWNANVALGTANSYTVPSSGVVLAFGAGTLVAGDSLTFSTSAPKWNTTQLATALDAVLESTQDIERVHVAGACSGSEKDTVIAKSNASHSAGKHRVFSCEARVLNVGESDSAYQTSVIASFASHPDTSVEVFAGDATIRSSVSSRLYRNTPAVAVVPRYAAVSPEIDIAAIRLGPLPGVQIKDDSGNPVNHDEMRQPGLDAAGFTVLRSWNNRSGVFVNNPRIQCPAGSDFQFVQLRRIMNLAREVIQAYLEERLSLPMQVDTTSGFLLKSEHDDIELGANNELWSVLGAKPMISGTPADKRFVLSSTDNVLSTQTLHYDFRIVPLGYPKTIVGTGAFNNPALRLITS